MGFLSVGDMREWAAESELPGHGELPAFRFLTVEAVREGGLVAKPLDQDYVVATNPVTPVLRPVGAALSGG